MTGFNATFFMALLTTLIFSSVTAGATDKGTQSGQLPYKDIYGNSYKKSETLFKDKDKNGARNMYQKRDRKQKATKNRRRR